jgi:hypothetical protein
MDLQQSCVQLDHIEPACTAHTENISIAGWSKWAAEQCGTLHVQDSAAHPASLLQQPLLTPSSTVRSSGGSSRLDRTGPSTLGGGIGSQQTMGAIAHDSRAAPTALPPSRRVASIRHLLLPHTRQTAGSTPQLAVDDGAAQQLRGTRRVSGFMRIKRQYASAAAEPETATAAAEAEAEGRNTDREDAVLLDRPGQSSVSRKHDGRSSRFPHP